MKRNFLVVATSGQKRECLARELRGDGYTVSLAASASEAERVVSNVAVDAVLIESNLPDLPAEELRTRLLGKRPECRVVIVTSFEHVRNSPGQLRLDDQDFLLRRDQVFELLRASQQAGRDSGSFVHRGNDALIQVIDVLVGLTELDDRFFGGSSHRAMLLARAVGEEMSADDDTVRELSIATLLRDIGKISLEPEFLDNPETFGREQRQRMEAHVGSSLRLFEHIDFPWKVMPIIRHHHERYDGKGYPDGLCGCEIPLGARIVAVIDTFAALTSERQHRAASDPEAALQELVLQAGHQFDPEVVEALQRVVDKRLSGRRARSQKPLVLIAEPHHDFRQLLKMRLLNEGYEIDEVNRQEQALGKVLKNPPDLLLADVDSATNDTFQLLQELREDERLCRVPVALMSQKSDRILKLRALREGVDDFLSKDCDMEELVARVENVITREANRRRGRTQRARRGISGDLEHLSLPDLIQTLVVGMKTARISLVAGKRKGQIWFENGAPKHAKTGRVQGEPAFFQMLRWARGEFVIEHAVTCRPTTLKQDAMYLLMEGLRRMDEESHKTSADVAS